MVENINMNIYLLHPYCMIKLTLSSKVALKAPSGVLRHFLICPLIPDTVRIAAPSNFATSKLVLNMPLMNAVFLNILYGSPVSFSFFITFVDLSISRTTPVVEIRKFVCLISSETDGTERNPVPKM